MSTIHPPFEPGVPAPLVPPPMIEARPTLPESEEDRLERIWQRPKSLRGFLTGTDSFSIGRRFIVTAFVFFVAAGVLALFMRLQLATPDGHILGPDRYNQFFTVHGSTMMFLFAVPVMDGFALALVPLMIGTRNVALPRLAAYSYWVYLIGGLLLWWALLRNMGPDAGWFSYVTLSGPAFAPGKRVDIWAQMITFTELSALGVAVSMISTILTLRAPGMSLSRMPLFVWAVLVMSFMVVFAMPAIMLASSQLALDRLVGTHFFNPTEGGDVLLWQHLFWFFGHPEVYIIFIPGLGMVSTVVSAFSRRPVFGYLVMVLSLVATAFMGFGLWVHHMFATGLPQIGEGFFSAASMMIAIPSGLQIFCWIATLARGRLILKTPMWFVLGFIAIFVLGGLTGVMLASVPLDLQLHDTYFVVAHFHYVLIGGAVFPLFAAVYHWFPKLTGRMLNDRAGRWHAALMFVGFNLTFFPMHVLGLEGMPRRVYTYMPQTGWGDLNLLASVGGVTMAVAAIVFLVNVFVSLRRGPLAGADPWGAETLEWSTSSPPPSYQFADLPTVSGRSPRWEVPENAPVVTGLHSDRREVLVTRAFDAEPSHRTELAGSAWAPLALALATAVTFIGAIFTPWAVPVGAFLVFLSLVGWFWPRKPHRAVLMERS